VIFHVLNRAVKKTRLFDTDNDYRAFLDIVVAALARHPIELFAFCVMSNHFHFLASPRYDGQLSAFMQWMTVTHSKRWHKWRGTTGTGHVYQGPFKAFPVQDDAHFLRVCRYVERNAFRAGLVPSTETWQWGSAHQYCFDCHWVPLTPWRIIRPVNWLDLLNSADPDPETIRQCLLRSRPYGGDEWTARMAEALKMAKSLQPIGRPPRK
jgi:putative transposase